MKNLPTVAAALALAIAPQAQALELSRTGTGQAVLLPYYTVRDGLSTVYSVTNHSDTEVKAVRIAVAEGTNGRVAISTNIYLRPRESWSGALAAGETGLFPRFITRDTACVAAGSNDGFDVSLRDFAYVGSRADALGSGPARTEFGQIEFIELGVLTGDARNLVLAGDCSGLRQRFQSPGIWSVDLNFDVTRPTGLISAEAQLIDVANGTAWDTPSYVFEDFSGAPRHGNGSIDFDAVRLTRPTLQPNQSVFALGEGVVYPATRGADAVSHLLMAAQLEGAMLLGDVIQGRTRWVVTFPTRRAYLDNLPGGELAAGTPAMAPFAGDGDATAPYCTATQWQAIARDGSLGSARDLDLCRQVNEVTLALQDAGEAGFDTDGVGQGTMRVSLRGDRHLLRYGYQSGPLTLEGTLQGLPVVGVSLMEARNANAQPGVLATYAVTGKVIRKLAGSPTP